MFSILVGDDNSGAGALATITAGTGGRSFTAGDTAALDEIFRDIDQMQKARFKQITADWVDDYTPLAIAGLTTAALYAFTLLGLRYVPW